MCGVSPMLLYSVLFSQRSKAELCHASLDIIFALLAPQGLLIYEMAENGKNCDQRRVAMNKEQYNGNFTGKSMVVWRENMYRFK